MAVRQGQGRPCVFTERSKVKFRKTACAVCRELERGGMKAGEDIFPAALMGRTPCVEPTQRITFVASRSLRYKRFGLLSEGSWPGSVHLHLGAIVSCSAMI